MELLVVTPGYPGADDLYNCGFVHSRVRGYRDRGIDAEAFVLAERPRTRRWEEVRVTDGSIGDLEKRLATARPDCVGLHFADRRVLDVLDRHALPVVVWVHGAEALRWYHRPLDLRTQPPTPRRILRNTRLLHRFGRFVRRHADRPSVRYVFPSMWMRDSAWADLRARSPHHHVIPNPIDADHFAFAEKSVSLRRHVLLVRPFHTRKYANDVAVAGLARLGGAIDRFRVTWYGDGPLFERTVAPIRNSPEQRARVRFERTFLSRDDLVDAHREHGVFLCPTRQDAQGVSMCEAMSSGLVPVTSNNTAIPEFVTDGTSGMLTNSPAAIARALLDLEANPDRFLAMSRAASRDIRARAGADGVLTRDIEVCETAIGTDHARPAPRAR